MTLASPIKFCLSVCKVNRKTFPDKRKQHPLLGTFLVLEVLP